QKHDVVVLNFLNKANAADQRVYELLDQKFKLFSGVFGASDEVLGALDAGIDFEKRIAEIYQRCRTPEQIEFEFNDLQEKLEGDINSRMSDTKRKLLENFDDEVQEKLRVGKAKTEELLSRHEAWLWQITKFYLQDYAEFTLNENQFLLRRNPFPGENIHEGPYQFGKSVKEANLYRVGHLGAKSDKGM
ncbi:MAG: DEAD/DEAH box helicase, partial [Bdellovibrionales bacterium]